MRIATIGNRYYGGQSADYVTANLQMFLDAGNPLSYSGSGTTWTCLEGSGTATLLGTGAPVYSSTDGGYIDFSGDKYATVSSSFTGLTGATIFTFIKRVGTSTAYTPILFSRGFAATGMNFYSNTYAVGYHWNDTVGSYSWNSGLIVGLNKWYMAAITVNSTKAIAYLGDETGIDSSTNSFTHSSTSMDNINLARDPVTTFRNASIYMSVGMIYNRALSPAEIEQNFNAFKSRYGY